MEFVDWSLCGSDIVFSTFTVSDHPIGKFKMTVSNSPSSPNGCGEISGNFYDLVPDALVDANITNETVGTSTTFRAVPLPCAAWQFGAALVGLTLIVRRSTTA